MENRFEMLAKIVADEFIETMGLFDYDTFEEMCLSYCWDSKDIKEEVDFIIREATCGVAFIDEEGGKWVFYGDDMIEYRKFTRMFRKLLK